MESLKTLFEAKLAFVEKQTNEPTPEQLGTFLRSMVTECGPVIRTLHNSEVERILRRGFASIGWDVNKNRAACASPPTMANIKDFLTRTLVLLTTYRPPLNQVSQAELADISLAAKKLWELDANRLTPGVDYAINLQRGKNFSDRGDAAPEPLFKFVSAEVLQRPTYRTFMRLLDNYEKNTGQAEVVTREELQENQAFLNACLDTMPMQYAHKWLNRKGLAPADGPGFRRLLDQLWFSLYRREVHNDSSGFEHVFIGESKAGKITGLHNWLQMYNEEKAGNLDYRGYIRPRVRGRGFSEPHDNEQLITVQFSWDDEIKPVSTSLIGVSPEFELSLLTMCFLNGEKDTLVELGPYRAQVTAFPFKYRGQNFIGSAFPGTAPMTEDQAARKLQSVTRGNQCRKQGARAYQEKKNEKAAASKIQSLYRGRKVRTRDA
eukprot:CAMPEP_0113936370 /NCGR_PEP_ID=MMETSP1339-20121228/3302_1 /TAXON_ID=94617 /ORGANISM="Fibrocapsa japonica" /LENGTH=433 /DNA_ID=CAMNT_0000938829 /DNA_START=51 /DNA_END=1352 /DNA_ORIENTATION=+ /assembly_acc=CAM_ASM_000762